MTTKLWAEVGIWNAGEPALLVMQGEYDDDGQIVDTPTVLHDVALDAQEDVDRDMLELPWQEPLAALGYRRVPGSNHEYLPYSVAFDIEEV
jgi:hypothetical protein